MITDSMFWSTDKQKHKENQIETSEMEQNYYEKSVYNGGVITVSGERMCYSVDGREKLCICMETKLDPSLISYMNI